MNFPHAVKPCPTQTSPCCDELGSGWGGEFGAHSWASPNLGAAALWGLGQKTASTQEFLCDSQSSRSELFLEGRLQEALRVLWFLRDEGIPAFESHWRDYPALTLPSATAFIQEGFLKFIYLTEEIWMEI